MRLTIPIFIAGAIDLKKEREQLLALSSEITSKYQNKGDDIVILMDSFESLGDKKVTHDDYIKDKADIVLFILDDKMGKFTRDEYILAEETFKSNKKKTPSIHVFLKEYDKENPSSDIVDIGNLMNEYGSFFTCYTDQEDLKNKAKAKIEEFIHQRIKQTKRKISIFKNIAFVAVITALALAGYGLYRYLYPDPLLVFAGGGSVYNYIKNHPVNEKTIDLRNYPNSCYIDMPSTNAWALLFENTYKNKNIDKKERKSSYLPICLSAYKISDNSLYGHERNEVQGHIIGIKLGHDDSLIVYIDTLCAKKWQYKIGIDSTISTISLKNKIKDIIANKDVKVFTTSTGSGTMKCYQDALYQEMGSVDFGIMSDLNLSHFFMDSSTESYFKLITKSNDRTHYPFIILGSEQYFVKDLEDQNMTKLYVTNGDEVIKKPIYIYFPVTTTVKDEEHWVIEPQIVNFLKSVVDNNQLNIKQWNNIINDKYVIIKDPDSLVITLND